jgi:hypothetical protein
LIARFNLGEALGRISNLVKMDIGHVIPALSIRKGGGWMIATGRVRSSTIIIKDSNLRAMKTKRLIVR